MSIPSRSSSPASLHSSTSSDIVEECEEGPTESAVDSDDIENDNDGNNSYNSDTDTGEELPCEEGEEEEKLVHDEEYPNIIWTGVNKRSPILIFSASAVLKKDLKMRQAADKYNMSFKIYQTECKLVRSIFHSHGFHEVHSNTSDYNVLWTGGHLKPYMLRSMCEFQKVNHFPRSYELTRKDRLFKNVQRMQHIKGVKHFDIVPPSFIIPSEFHELCNFYMKDKGHPYIVKPVASSRGRGIFICTHPDQIPLDETMICSKYVSNPYLIDGFKFDIRFYVAVTSYDPLVIYLYEEGLSRFATMKYQQSNKNVKQHFMHLTNYSINKKNQDFVQNDDADVEDFGNKWSLGAVLRYLRAEGKDTTAIMMRIEDVIIKAIISVESHITTATKMFQPTRNICFELYGFDIILDENLRPWLLEVNLSPSLACDSPLDFKIKCNMLTDLFSLIGIPCQDPAQRTASMRRANGWTHNNMYQRRSTSAAGVRSSSDKASQQSAAARQQRAKSATTPGLTTEEARIVRRVREEFQRRGGWLRIFPTKNSWDLYGAFIQSTANFNLLLHQKLFPSFWQDKLTVSSTDARPPSASSSSATSVSPNALKSKLTLHSISTPYLELGVETSTCHSEQFQRLNGVYNTVKNRAQFYERKLGQKPAASKRKRKKRRVLVAAHSPRFAKPSHSHGGSMRQVRTITEKDSYFRGNLARDVDQEVESESESTCTKSQAETQECATVSDAKEPPPEVRSSSSAPQKHKRSPLSLIINKGDKMTKIQARNAFATYLSRVQKRLLLEGVQQLDTSTEQVNNGGDQQPDEQMDLVLRFLRRAAKNVTPEFKVVVPSRKLPQPQRKHILATMLSDFIRLYKKETELMSVSESKLTTANQSSDNSATSSILDKEFKDFIDYANENELEKILTNYTRVNKSAGIFITSHHQTEHNSSTPAQSDNSAKQSPSLMASVNSSMRSAAIAYSQRLQRPSSASASLRGATLPQYRSPTTAYTRPTSSMGSRSNPYNFGMPSVESYDDVAINDALHKLTLRQHTRQYSATKVETLLDKGGVVLHPSPAAHSQNYTPTKLYPKRSQTSTLIGQSRRPGSAMSSYGRQQQETSWSGCNAANNLLHQFQQSRNLLEHSRAKHDAMIAKASSLSAQTDKLYFSTSLANGSSNHLTDHHQTKHPKPPAGPKPSQGPSHHHKYSGATTTTSSSSRPMHHSRLLIGAE